MLHKQTDRALAAMIQLGVALAGQAPQPISELLLVTGVPVELRYGADQETYLGLKYYVGLAVR
jgi:hypothetical protein